VELQSNAQALSETSKWDSSCKWYVSDHAVNMRSATYRARWWHK